MPDRLLRMILIVALVAVAAPAFANGRAHHVSTHGRHADIPRRNGADSASLQTRQQMTRRAATRGGATDSAAPYRTDRLSSSRGETVLDTPGQTTVLTRQMLDDMNAGSLGEALRSTAGVTVGR